MELNKKQIIENSLSIDGYVSCGIYFLIKGVDIVYVGQTKRGIQRVLNHHNKKDFDKFYFHKSSPWCDLDSLELKYIMDFKPLYNRSIASIGGYTLHKLNSLYKESFGRRNMPIVQRILTENDIEGVQFGGRIYFTQEQADMVIEIAKGILDE